MAPGVSAAMNARRVVIGVLCFGIAMTAGRMLALGAIANSDDNFEIRWDNTVKLGATYALGVATPIATGYCPSPVPYVSNGVTQGNGDCRYRSDFNAARIDWLSQVDLDYGGVGIHASAAAWYDAVNNSENNRYQNLSYQVIDASELGGHHIELFEAFVHDIIDLGGDQSLSVRLGRHTLTWGESVYFPGNGIAAGQSPVDTYMSQTATNYQSKDLLLPVGQASFSWQTGGALTVEGYYQFEWRRSRIDPQASYSTANDVLGTENSRLIVLTIPGRGEIRYNRIADQIPASNDQYGLALKWRLDTLDLGLYGVRFNAKSPEIYYYPGSLPGLSPRGGGSGACAGGSP